MARSLLILVLLLNPVHANEAIDQAAHAGIGFAASYGLSMFIGPFAIPVVVGAAYVRELKQHEGKPDGEGSIRDMAYWSIGAALGAAAGM